jgi:D-serine deaminase-like pyridoxal phosphate-dependent protein
VFARGAVLSAQTVATPSTAAEIGMTLDDVPTPAMIVDLGRMERNIASFQAAVIERGKRIRAHAKTHKIPEIALRQLADGACGIAAAKPSEAQPFHDAGIRDIAVAFPSVGADKWQRLAAMAADADVTCNVDSDEQASGLSRAAVERDVTVSVQIEIDTGFHRVGIPIEQFDAIAEFARTLIALPGLELAGITTHRGKLAPGLAELTNDEAGAQEGELMVALAERLRSAGIPVREVTAGGTVTGRGVATVDGITEVRAGTYPFYDAMMVALGVATPDQLAATILATVVSVRRAGWATIDAGTKTFSAEGAGVAVAGPAPGVVARAVGIDAAVARTTEEHGMVALGSGVSAEIGQRLRFVPYHVCTAVNLCNELVGVRDGVVEQVWPVLARGCRT